MSEQVRNLAETSRQISSGVQNVAATTEEQTAAMEEVSAAAEQLAAMAGELETMVELYFALLHHLLDLLLQLGNILHFGVTHLGKHLADFGIGYVHHMFVVHGLQHHFILQAIL